MSTSAGAVVFLWSITARFDFTHDLTLELMNHPFYRSLVFHHLQDILGRDDARLKRSSSLSGEEDAGIVFACDTDSRDVFVD